MLAPIYYFRALSSGTRLPGGGLSKASSKGMLFENEVRWKGEASQRSPVSVLMHPLWCPDALSRTAMSLCCGKRSCLIAPTCTVFPVPMLLLEYEILEVRTLECSPRARVLQKLKHS
jgi:hypothetical protein|mmetsp:Transcript_41126/g.93056  ORF Transcript_41126/g.93056 Transcript_41126/m.93056 type:complete len:117 (+) Transcript_41126:274-624(+)